MRIIFFMDSPRGYFRLFEPAFRRLLEHGHEIELQIEREAAEGMGDLEAFADEHPGFSFRRTRELRRSPWFPVARRVRLAADYVYFQGPAFQRAPYLRARAERRAPDVIRRLAALPGGRSAPARIALGGVLRALERAVPVFDELRRSIRVHQPDVVLLAPRLMPGALHSEYVRASHAAGTPVGICVPSWDNLSSKQVLRTVPDALLVWNDIQRREAIELHGVPPERVVVTGAQVYDQWFDWRPREREDFCRRVGLPPERPYLLWTGGSLFPGETTESDLVVRWLEMLRGSPDPALREVGVLVRPHPHRVEEWRDADLSGFDAVSVWPRGEGRMPVDAALKADLHDSIFHSQAVVGLNTSAMIEAGIVGRRVHALLLPEFSESQEGTPHFRYLLEAGGGLLHVARSLDENLEQLAGSLRADRDARAENLPFVEAFVRPHGIESAATPRFVDAVERLAASEPLPLPSPAPWHGLARRVLARLARRIEQQNLSDKRLYYPEREEEWERLESEHLKLADERQRSYGRGPGRRPRSKIGATRGRD